MGDGAEGGFSCFLILSPYLNFRYLLSVYTLLVYMGKTIRTKEYAVFIERMVKARKDSGLRQIDVAKKMKRPQSYISRVESGEYRLDILEVKKFAQLYGKDINYFIK